MERERPSMIGRKAETEDDLVCLVREFKDRERNRHRLIWIDWLNVLVAFHNRPDLRASEDLRLVSRVSRREIAKLREITVNYVQPHVRTTAAKLQKARPMLECVPASTDEVDIQAAKVGDRLLKSEWARQDMDTIRLEAAIWMASTGNSFLHVFFDREAGDLGPSGNPLGEIRTECISPFKLVFEPFRKNIRDCRWVILSQRLPVDQVQENYQKIYQERTGKELVLTGSDTSEDVSGSGDVVTDSYLSMVGITDQTNLNDSDTIDIDILYHLPCERYPGGIYAVVAGKIPLYVGPYPYPFLGRLPIVHFREIMSPWRLYGDTGTVGVLNNQTIYHELRSIEKDYHRANTAAKVLVPVVCKVNGTKLQSKHNEVVPYRPGRNGEKPERMPGIGVPSSIYQSISLAQEEIRTASGLSEASMGNVPEGASSGRAILALQEQDDTRLGLTVQLAEAEYSALGTMHLRMAKEFYEEPRKLAIAGEALAGSVWCFDKADLGNTTDVRCVPGTALPQNKLAKQQNVVSLFQAGILGNPQDPETQIRARRMLEFGQVEDMHDDDAMDEAVAEKENVFFLTTSQVMPPAPIDNHMLHIKVHLRRAKAPGVRDVPERLALIEQHIQMHQMAMAPASMPGPGSPGNPPGSPPQPGQEPPQPGPNGPESGSVATSPVPGGAEPNDVALRPSDMPQGGQ